MFSSRVPRSLQPNRITQAVRRARADGRGFIDLTATNPTTVGLDYAPAALSALTDTRALTYEPEPFGLLSARRAVACDFARRGSSVDPRAASRIKCRTPSAAKRTPSQSGSAAAEAR